MNVHIYIYIHTYVYMCIHMCIHICIYIYIYIYIYNMRGARLHLAHRPRRGRGSLRLRRAVLLTMISIINSSTIIKHYGSIVSSLSYYY